MNFAAMLLMTAVMLIRPSEIFLEIYATQTYLLSIVIAAIASIPELLRLLTTREIKASPITVCVLGVLVALPTSHITHRSLGTAIGLVNDFGRIVLFFLIVRGALTTPRRLSAYLAWIAICIGVQATIVLMDYHGYYDLVMLDSRIAEGDRENPGLPSPDDRLQYSGIFNNPNGVARVMVTGIMLSLYQMMRPGGFLAAPFWLALMGLLGHALMLTRSRGGLLGLLAGVAILFVGRFGLKRAIPLGLIAVPALLMAFGGSRQSDISTAEGTGQHRIQLWYSGLLMLQYEPLFGIGAGQYVEYMKYVAHNSFVHAYVEIGLIGGTFFVGLYYFGLDTLLKLRKYKDRLVDPTMRRTYPFLIAMMGGEAAGMLSISLSYTVTTYMTMGIAASYIRMVEEQPGIPARPFDRRAAKQLAAVGVGTLVGLYVFIKFSIR